MVSREVSFRPLHLEGGCKDHSNTTIILLFQVVYIPYHKEEIQTKYRVQLINFKEGMIAYT